MNNLTVQDKYSHPNKQCSCIYKISITGSTKVYIGSAVNYANRRKKHLSQLQKNQHPNKHLQNSFDKHGGKEVFSMEVIEEVPDISLLLEREQHYIDMYDFDSLFNNARIAGSNLGIKCSEETIEKIRENSRKKVKPEFCYYWKGRKRPPEFGEAISRRQKVKKLPQSVIDKVRESNKGKTISEPHKEALLNSWRGSHHSEESKQRIREGNLGKKRSESTKRNHQLSHPSKKSVQQIDVDNGNVIASFISIAEASRITGITQSGIYNCVSKRVKTAGGYAWTYFGEDYVVDQKKLQKVYQIDPTTNNTVDSFSSMAEASRKTGYNQKSISKCVKGISHSYKGYKWKIE